LVVVVEWQPQVLMSCYLQITLCHDHFLVGLPARTSLKRSFNKANISENLQKSCVIITILVFVVSAKQLAIYRRKADFGVIVATMVQHTVAAATTATTSLHFIKAP
jgi:hypothetical protein